MFFAFCGEEADNPAVVGVRSSTGRGGTEPAPCFAMTERESYAMHAW